MAAKEKLKNHPSVVDVYSQVQINHATGAVIVNNDARNVEIVLFVKTQEHSDIWTFPAAGDSYQEAEENAAKTAYTFLFSENRRYSQWQQAKPHGLARRNPRAEPRRRPRHLQVFLTDDNRIVSGAKTSFSASSSASSALSSAASVLSSAETSAETSEKDEEDEPDHATDEKNEMNEKNEKYDVDFPELPKPSIPSRLTDNERTMLIKGIAGDDGNDDKENAQKNNNNPQLNKEDPEQLTKYLLYMQTQQARQVRIQQDFRALQDAHAYQEHIRQMTVAANHHAFHAEMMRRKYAFHLHSQQEHLRRVAALAQQVQPVHSFSLPFPPSLSSLPPPHPMPHHLPTTMPPDYRSQPQQPNQPIQVGQLKQIEQKEIRKTEDKRLTIAVDADSLGDKPIQDVKSTFTMLPMIIFESNTPLLPDFLSMTMTKAAYSDALDNLLSHERRKVLHCVTTLMKVGGFVLLSANKTFREDMRYIFMQSTKPAHFVSCIAELHHVLVSNLS